MRTFPLGGGAQNGFGRSFLPAMTRSSFPGRSSNKAADDSVGTEEERDNAKIQNGDNTKGFAI